MKTRPLPRTNLTASVLCLGTAEFGSGVDKATAEHIIESYLEAGGNVLDTAEIYAEWLPGGSHRSEELLGRWLRRRKSREGLIISTKGAHPRLDSMDRPRMSKAEVQADLGSSLKRLGIDCVDIYWLHRDDRGTPVADILLMLDDFRRAGKIRYAGFSNWTLARAEAARVAAEELNIQGFIASQNQWSLARADAAKGDPTWAYVDEPFIAWHQQYQFVAFPYTPQANGYFRRLESGTLPEAPALVRALFHSPTNERRYDRIREIRAKSGYRTGDIVLAYLLNQPFPVFPIIGPRKLPDLEESVKAADLILTPDQLQFLVAP